MKLLAQGAEAKIFINDDILIKQRLRKKYRISILDDKLIKNRISNEVRIMNKTSLNTPIIYLVDNYNIYMEYIKAEMIKNIINQNNLESIGNMIGNDLSILHNENIIHGDLTTSNILYSTPSLDNPSSDIPLDTILNTKSSYTTAQSDERSNKKSKLIWIDFGLSSFSSSVEDKAVDLYLLEKSIISTHPEYSEELIQIILSSYSHKKILKRLEIVRERGRKRDMIG